MNGPLEKLCKVAGSSIADAAEEIGMPRMLVDIRHGKKQNKFYDLDTVHQLFGVKSIRVL